MIATFKKSRLRGIAEAPPSKSMAHRYLIGGALSGAPCTLTGVDYSEDILATMDCLKALGAAVTADKDTVHIASQEFMQADDPVLDCRESGSTLRFFIPLALCLGKRVTLRGSERLMERPLDVYEELCREKGFAFQRDSRAITLCGKLTSGTYTVRGDISSQFITGMLFALVYLNESAYIRIIPPFESRSYVDLTIAALRAFGADMAFTDACTIRIGSSELHGFSGKVEGDYSNAAFLDAFNYIGSTVTVTNLAPDSQQGDRVYKGYFEKIAAGSPTPDITDCPDLGPVLFALAALKHGAVFTGTNRLKIKESDRAAAMREELKKLGGDLIVGDNTVTVPRQALAYHGIPLDGHNDHRIVMALSLILSQTGGTIHGIEAVRKSYPAFFEVIRQLGAEVDIV